MEISATKFYGKVYTPAWVVQEMLGRVVGSLTEGVRICDPACGSGDFLVPIAEEVCARASVAEDAAHYWTTLRCLTGYDIDAQAAQLCRERLSEVCERVLGRSLPPDWWRIFNMDALEAWHRDRDSFDWVVGNPPYVRVQHLEKERREQIRRGGWQYFRGSGDLYMVFFELGLRLLRRGGRLQYISPSGWLRNMAGSQMREDLERNHGIEAIYDFKDYQVFPRVSTYTCITQFRKNDQSGETLAQRWTGTEFAGSYQLRKESFGWSIDDVRPRPESSVGTVRLGDITDINVGIQTLADSVFILNIEKWGQELIHCSANGTAVVLEKEAVKRILKASVLKNGKDPVDRVVIYPYDESGRLIEEKNLAASFPRAYRWLLTNKSRLLARDKGAFSAARWYAYGRSVGILSALGKKILTSGMNPRPNFQICLDPETLFYSGYGIKPRDGITMKSLQKALNSEAMDQHIRMVSQPFRGGWFSYAKRYVQEFRVPVKALSYE